MILPTFPFTYISVTFPRLFTYYLPHRWFRLHQRWLVTVTACTLRCGLRTLMRFHTLRLPVPVCSCLASHSTPFVDTTTSPPTVHCVPRTTTLDGLHTFPLCDVPYTRTHLPHPVYLPTYVSHTRLHCHTTLPAASAFRHAPTASPAYVYTSVVTYYLYTTSFTLHHHHTCLR